MSRYPIPESVKGQPWSDILWEDVLQYTQSLDQFSAVPKQGIIVDIGGNIGCAAILFHLHYQAKIFSVEAIKETYRSLEKNCEPYPDIIPIHTAIGEFEGQMQLYRYPLAPGLGGLEASRRHILVVLWKQAFQNISLNKLVDILLLPFRILGLILWMFFCIFIVLLRFKQEVPLQTLSTLFAHYIHDEPISVLKIDIEGHELSALRGLKGADWSRIQTIIMEVHPQNLAEVTSLLQQHQFSIQSIEKGVITLEDAPKVLVANRL